jgi:hypothetical protein
MTSAALRLQLENALEKRVPAAFSRKVCDAPELMPSGIAQVDELLDGGIPRGGFTEIVGAASSGRTALALSILGRASQENACAWVDVYDALDPESAAACGVNLSNLLWLRMNEKPVAVRKGFVPRKGEQKPWSRLDQALKATDLLLQAGGFCAVVLDMSDVRAQDALRVPLASWYRFRLAAAQARTALILLAQTACAKSSASLALRCAHKKCDAWSAGDQAALFENARQSVAVERKRGEENIFACKKSPQSVSVVWTGENLWTRDA